MREALSSRKNACSGLETKEVSYSNLVVAVKYTLESANRTGGLSVGLLSYEKKSGRASYLQLFKDCGWEHITDFNGFPTLEALFWSWVGCRV